MNRSHPSPAVALLIDLFYAAVALAGWPVLLVLMLTRRKWREGFRERMGWVPRLPARSRRIWVHAISVGEVEAARPLVRRLRERYLDAEIVISTTTRTGRARARKLFPDLLVFHYPLDLPWAVRSTLRRIRPTVIVQVEAEWWPGFLLQTARRGIPLCMVNVRITEKAARGYRWLGSLFAEMVRCVSVIGVQDRLYADRLRSLVGSAGRIVVTGQMKYDNVTFEPVPGAERLARDVGIGSDQQLVVAGSTGPGEEELILDAYRRLKPDRPRLRLALVPRKPERFEEAARLVTEWGFRLVRRSETRDHPAEADPEAVVLGDTMGELMVFYQLAACVVIGRSFVPMGGSNPFDPAGLGLPLVFGPHMFNFPEAEELFVRSGAARVAQDADSLAETLAEMLESEAICAAMGERGREAVRRRQGATEANLALVERVLARSGATHE